MNSKEAVARSARRDDLLAWTCLFIAGAATCIIALVLSLFGFLLISRTFTRSFNQTDPTSNIPTPITTPVPTVGSGLGDYALTLMQESCPTYPAGTIFEGWVSHSKDPLAPWSRTSVHFKGTDQCGRSETFGGASLIYRYKIEFPRVTQLTSVSVSGVAFNGPNSLLRVLDENMNILGSVTTSGGNTFHVFRIDLGDVEGMIFYVDEFDTSAGWRYRHSIIIK